jgi:hypothetical protein
MGRHYDVSRGARLWPIVHNRLRLVIDEQMNPSLTPTTL